MSNVQVIAHRGASRAERENTLEAFRRAGLMGADAVELDVRRTADGAMAIHHDASLSDGRLICELQSTDLPTHVPLLSAALDACEGMWVNIEIKNFKFTVLGQVKAPGIHTVSTDRLKILEAIGKAGDIQITGLRNNVLVVREMNGQRIEYRLDLTNKSIYNSPAFYICQNDVIYVEPNFTANFQGTNFQTYTQLGTTLVSIFLSVFTLITLTK